MENKEGIQLKGKVSHVRTISVRLDDRDPYERSIISHYDNALSGRKHDLIRNMLVNGYIAQKNSGTGNVSSNRLPELDENIKESIFPDEDLTTKKVKNENANSYELTDSADSDVDTNNESSDSGQSINLGGLFGNQN